MVTTEGREVASSRLPLLEPQKLRRLNQQQLQPPATASLQTSPQLKVCSCCHSCTHRMLSATCQNHRHAQHWLRVVTLDD